MHILIGLLTAIAGLVWALYRLQNSGVDLNAFNPFYWARRRQWEKQLGTRPLHRLVNPMEAAAVLMVAVAKMEGEVTREQKREIIGLFEQEFKLNNRDASELFNASSHLLKDVINFSGEVKNILAPCRDRFTPEQKESLLQMLQKVAGAEGEINREQREFIDIVDRELPRVPPTRQSHW